MTTDNEAAAVEAVQPLLDRIDAAIDRITSGRGHMRIPAEQTDPDLVLADAGNWIKRAAIAAHTAASAGEGYVPVAELVALADRLRDFGSQINGNDAAEEVAALAASASRPVEQESRRDWYRRKITEVGDNEPSVIGGGMPPVEQAASAGEVACWQRRVLLREGHWGQWEQYHDMYDEGRPEFVGRFKCEYRQLYTAPPAAVPADALELLVEKWRGLANGALRYSGTWSGEDMVDRIETMSDELAALIPKGADHGHR